uniref:Uncharacterized protein MANES_16G052500 n=1 Tax=Rhizophora mucronata TaxID=61149 RepID=A0A2P2JWJ9_RHIMU
MDDSVGRGDVQVNVVRQLPLRPNSILKSTFSGKSSPRNSPTFRRLHSSRTPRREGRSIGGGIQWFRSSRIVYWLLLITLWTYLGFYVQSRWAHGDNREEFLDFLRKSRNQSSVTEKNSRRDLLAKDIPVTVKNRTTRIQVEDGKRNDVVLAKKGNEALPKHRVTSRKKGKKSGRRLRGKAHDKSKATAEILNNYADVQEPDIPQTNTSYGLLVGPFGSIENKILEWSPEKRMGTCDRKGQFARLVWSRKFVLIFHELSMTGAPLSMLELATELLSCGATVSAVVLSKKGGLMPELARRRIKVLEDRADFSFKTAMKADLVIAGSAVCASWIDQYITHFPAGGSQIAWWIMENRQEYFNRSKIAIDRVKMLVFLSESQSKQWLTWCKEENIRLRSPPAVIQLSINDELAFVAGITCSLNSPSSSPEKMQEKKKLLRASVRKEMGLTDNDMLVMSLSSINPGKGQFLLLESTDLVIGQEPFQNLRSSLDMGEDVSSLAAKHHLRTLLQELSDVGRFSKKVQISGGSSLRLNEHLNSINHTDVENLDKSHRRKALSNHEGVKEQALKVLIGSVGSKSNKVFYVKDILRFLSNHLNLSQSVLWTPATTRVASLYSAADVYVINSQGVGETFGRVTIEAMAFGLPVRQLFPLGFIRVMWLINVEIAVLPQNFDSPFMKFGLGNKGCHGMYS